MTGPWTESARAKETLHDAAIVTLLKSPDPARQKALGRLLGIAGDVDSLVIRITKNAAGVRVGESAHR